MQITDIINQAGGMQAIARELGISESQAAAGSAALAPAILGGFKRQAQAPAGLTGLGGLLGQLGGGGLLDSVLSPEPTDIGRGNEVLGQIFGSKDVSRTVAQNAASQSGLDPAVIKKMLPIVAMLVAGYMAKQHGASTSPGASGGLAGVLGGLIGGGQTPRAMPSRNAGLGSMLDLDGDGNPLDDILRMAGKLR